MRITDFAVGDLVVVNHRPYLTHKGMTGTVTGIDATQRLPIKVKIGEHTFEFAVCELRKDPTPPSQDELMAALVELAAQALYVSSDATVLVPIDDVCCNCLHNHHGDDMEVIKDFCKWCEANAAIALFGAQG